MASDQPDGRSPKRRLGFLSGLTVGVVGVLTLSVAGVVTIAGGFDDLPVGYGVPGDGADMDTVKSCPAAPARSEVVRTIRADSGGTLVFDSDPRHRLVVRRRLDDGEHFTITMADAKPPARGVVITTGDKDPPRKHWGVLFLDYGGCNLARQNHLGVAVVKRKGKPQSRAGAVLAEDSTVIGWIRGASEYILGAN